MISASSDEIHRIKTENLNNSDDISCNSNDYSEKSALKITIPDCNELTAREKYVVFNVYVSGRLTCSRRYKEFDMFHSLLKQEFPDFNFPSFPKKWPFRLSEQQLDNRRKSLENYLDKSKQIFFFFSMKLILFIIIIVCSVKIIF